MTKELLNLSDLNLPNLPDLALPQAVKDLIKVLSDYEGYLVGGFVRDLVLGKPSFDMDFVIVDKDTDTLGKELTRLFEGHYFVLDKDTKTTRFVLSDEGAKNYTFDFTSVSKGQIEEDFQRRDFTINALAIDLKKQNYIVDKFGGVNDLKERKIKAIRLENFLDDPLRFLRAFRFATLLNGEIENETLLFIKNNVSLRNVAPERIATEIWKIFDNDSCFKYIKQISEIGLLEEIFPETTPMRKVTPNSHHHLWLYDHSVELVKTFEENYSKIPQWAKEELNSPIGNAISPTKKGVAKLASFLHDVGKPDTWEIKKIDEKEKHTFYGHDKTGAEIVNNISERMKFSNAITEMLSKLVRYHLRPFQLSQNNQPISERALFRFFRDLGDDTAGLLALAMADLYATLGPEITKENLENGEKLLLFLFEEFRKYRNKETEKANKPKLIDGNEIMKLTGLKPSKELGELMKSLDEAIGIGEVKTKEEALEWVKKAK